MSTARPARSGGTTAATPTPMLNVANISSRAMRPPRARTLKMGGTGHAAVSMRTRRAGGRIRTRLPGSPPPVMWAAPRSHSAPASACSARRYEWCGRSKASASVPPRSGKTAGSVQPHRRITSRPSVYPFVCSPFDASPITASPARMFDPSQRPSRSATPITHATTSSPVSV